MDLCLKDSLPMRELGLSRETLTIIYAKFVEKTKFIVVYSLFVPPNSEISIGFVSLGTNASPKRNRKQCLCKFGGQSKSMMVSSDSVNRPYSHSQYWTGTAIACSGG